MAITAKAAADPIQTELARSRKLGEALQKALSSTPHDLSNKLIKDHGLTQQHQNQQQAHSHKAPANITGTELDNWLVNQINAKNPMT